MTVLDLVCGIGIIILIAIYIINEILINVFRKKGLVALDRTFPAILFGLVFLFVLTLAFRQSGEEDFTNWIIIFLTFGLVVVALLSMMSASKQANASVKMAEVTEKSVAEMVRPMLHVSVVYGQGESDISFKNIGRGPALHVEAKARDPYFEYEGPLPGTVVEVGQVVSLHFDIGAKPKFQEAFELIAKYQNLYGKWFRSRLTRDEHGQYHLEYEELEMKEND